MASQPCRAVVAFCNINNIPFEKVDTVIFKLQHRDEEYAKMNPNTTVPTMKDGDFVLWESHAILRYLCRTREVSDHWYPADAKKRAIVDQYLDWHHTNIRIGSGMLVFKSIFGPKMGIKTSEEVLKQHKTMLLKSLKMYEKWLEHNDYICGEKITIADLSAACELVQSQFLDFDLSKWPKTKAWMERVIAIPEVKEAHAFTFKAIARTKQVMKKQAKL
jgi:glutathione S-transferase